MILKVVLAGGKTIVGSLVSDEGDHLVVSSDGREIIILKEQIKRVEIVVLC